MKNSDQWRPSKFTWKNGKLRGSRNAAELQLSSRLVADIVANYYQRYLTRYATGKLIDLGCGRVPFYGLYKDHVDSITCVDWENSVHQNPFLDLTCDLTQPLPFSDESFDTILLSDVLEHIPEPENLWKEMQRILRPEGRIILNVPFFYKLHEIPHDYLRYTEFALRRFAERNRLKVVLLTPMGGIPEVVSDLMAKLFYKIPFAGSILAMAVQSMCNLFIRTGPGRRISNKTAPQFPMGYFMVTMKVADGTHLD